MVGRAFCSRFRCLCHINIPTDTALHLHLLYNFYKFVSVSPLFLYSTCSTCSIADVYWKRHIGARDPNLKQQMVQKWTSRTDWLLCGILKQTVVDLKVFAFFSPLRYFPPNTFDPWENLSPWTFLLFVESAQVYLWLAGLCYNVHPAPFIMSTPISADLWPPTPARNLTKSTRKKRPRLNIHLRNRLALDWCWE